MGPFLHPFARPAAPPEAFTTIVRGEGAAVYDADGTRYVDALASLWYCQVGHGRAEIADAVHAQMRELETFHTFERFTNGPAERFCARVAALAPMDDARVFLVGSGSEAVDSALKLARLACVRRGEPDRHVVVTREDAYHGVTYGGTSVQGLAPNREGFGPLLPGIVTVGRDDVAALEQVFAEHGDRVAAFIAEPVMGAGGVRPPADGYLQAARALCDRHGAFLLLDEVICGFGRLGRWWGAERYGVRPDLVTFAKGCTSGYLPLGGVLVGPAVREPLEADPAFLVRHGHTYSGHATACAAGLANIDVIEREGLPAAAERIGATVGPALDALVDAGLGTGARGVAGLWALELPAGVDAPAVRDAMVRRGVITRPLGTSIMALCPPLVIDDADLGLVLSALREGIEEVAAGG